MFKLVSKRELALYVGQIQDLRSEIADLNKKLDHERARAEAAINMLLMRVAKAAITPDEKVSIDEQDSINQRQLDIWGDGNLMTEEEAIDALQR